MKTQTVEGNESNSSWHESGTWINKGINMESQSELGSAFPFLPGRWMPWGKPRSQKLPPTLQLSVVHQWCLGRQETGSYSNCSRLHCFPLQENLDWEPQLRTAFCIPWASCWWHSRCSSGKQDTGQHKNPSEIEPLIKNLNGGGQKYGFNGEFYKNLK